MQHTSPTHQPATSQPAAQREAKPGSGTLSVQLAQSPRQAAQRRQLDDLRAGPVQRTEGLEDEAEAGAAQLRALDPVQRQDNRTGMPDGLKAGIESLSGMDMSDVRVHRNSSQPAQLNARAYAQGNDIHLGPGQEQHLPHEAWHVVQQRQGRVQATMQMAGVGVNDDEGLEREADVMGVRAVQLRGDGGKRQDLTPNLQVRKLQALQAMADQHASPSAQGILSRMGGAAARPAGTVQRTAGVVYEGETTKWVIFSKQGSHGPYTIANLDAIDPNLLDANVEVDYTNMGNGKVWIDSIGNANFAPPLKEVKKEETSPIDPEHFVNNSLGIGNTDKGDPKDRPWLRGTSFKVDFGEDIGSVSVDGFAKHLPLHEKSDESGGFRGNSVKLSMSLYYQDDKKALQQQDFSVKGFKKFHSAEFGKYSTKDLNDMYAIGRLITSNEKYTNQDALKDVAARYHSERDMVVKAEQMKSPRFAYVIAGTVQQIMGEGHIPKLLILHLHSHELRICGDCYQFLDAFMQGDWITDVKDLVPNGEHLQITMLTSADQPHSVLSGKVNDERSDGATVGIGELPRILNMGQLQSK